MIALDTNVVLRLLVRDDPAQTAEAAALVRDNDLLVTTTVLLEAEWVLRSRYGTSRRLILAGLRRLVDLDRLTVDQPAAAHAALDLFEGGMDFADALHLAQGSAATEFATFDRKLARRATRLGAKPPVRELG